MMANIRKCNVFIKQVEDHKANFPADWIQKRVAEARFLRAYFYHQAWMAYGGLPIITVPLDRNTQGDAHFLSACDLRGDLRVHYPRAGRMRRGPAQRGGCGPRHARCGADAQRVVRVVRTAL